MTLNLTLTVKVWALIPVPGDYSPIQLTFFYCWQMSKTVVNLVPGRGIRVVDEIVDEKKRGGEGGG